MDAVNDSSSEKRKDDWLGASPKKRKSSAQIEDGLDCLSLSDDLMDDDEAAVQLSQLATMPATGKSSSERWMARSVSPADIMAAGAPIWRAYALSAGRTDSKAAPVRNEQGVLRRLQSVFDLQLRCRRKSRIGALECKALVTADDIFYEN